VTADSAPRRALPTNIRRINPARPKADTAVPAARPVPPAPDWLDAAARAEWERLAPALTAGYRPEFEDALCAYVVLWAQFKANPGSFGAPRLSQLRAFQNALALNPRAYRILMDSPGKR
jgi:phage terminase small subunit